MVVGKHAGDLVGVADNLACRAAERIEPRLLPTLVDAMDDLHGFQVIAASIDEGSTVIQLPGGIADTLQPRPGGFVLIGMKRTTTHQHQDQAPSELSQSIHH